MVRTGGSYGSSAEMETQQAPRSQPNYKVVVAGVLASLAMIAFVAVIMQQQLPTELEAQDDTSKALSLEMSKQKYDQAKARVKKLHAEFARLKAQLSEQVKSLQSARGDLVDQISSAEGTPLLSKTAASTSSAPSDVYQPSATLKTLRDAAATLASAGTSRDAADAATHALSYTQQVASRVGDLADQSEEQAKRIVDAARLAQEAKEAMRAALEQSSKIVDYNTHAAQAVAQDSGFVTMAAQTISGYLHNIYHDSRAVHAAAVEAVKHMNSDVTAADHAVSEIESDAQEAYDILEHMDSADKAATDYAQHARAAAVTAATAANGALKGERAAMVGGLKSIASARSAQAGAQAAMEYAKAAEAATHPYVYGEEQPAAEQAQPAAESAPGDLVGAKELVDNVVVLMQQLTNALESASDCSKVQDILTYYQATMSKYHQEGQKIAGSLNDEDMDLVEQYAQTQVAAFATELEDVVRKTAEKCSMPVTNFIPDAAVEKKAAPAQPSTLALQPPSIPHNVDANAAEAKIAKLKKELAWVKRERLLQKQTQAPVMKRAAPVALEEAVQHEQRRVNALKAQIAALQQEKASLTDTL